MTRTTSLLAAAFLMTTAAAYAQGVGPAPTSADAQDVTRTLTYLGYTDIRNLRQEGSIFAADAKLDGKPVQLRVDRSTGRVSSIGDPSASAIYAREYTTRGKLSQQLQALGYANVSNVSRSGNIIEADAVRDGRLVRLRVDAESGRVMDNWQDVGLAIRPSKTTNNEYFRKELEGLGYSNVSNVAREGRIFQADAVRLGHPVRVRVDVESGRVTDSGMATPLAIEARRDMSPEYVRQELQRLGFTNVDRVTRSGNIYDAKATHNGRQIELRVDGGSGKISLGG